MAMHGITRSLNKGALRWLATAGAAFIVAACSDPVSPANSASVPAGAQRNTAALGGSHVKNYDEHLLDIAEAVPGFGGLYHDQSGALHILLTSGAAPDASARVRALLSQKGMHGGAPVVEHAHFDFVQLSNWLAAYRSAPGISGVSLSGISKPHNRLEFGVVSPAAQATLTSALLKAGIPTEAFSIAVMPYASLNSGTLWDVQRPLVGGLLVNPYGCTLTAVAYANRPYDGGVDSSTAYFVTASHCTSNFGQVNGDIEYQPVSGYSIGQEIVDPPLFTHGSTWPNSACAVGQWCRLSDAAMFQQSNVGSWVGTIALSAPTSSNAPPYNDVHTISGTIDESALYADMWLSKVGATTGETSGNVYGNEMCQNVTATDGITRLCSFGAAYYSKGGDSGAPVFAVDNPSVPGERNSVKLVGIHWGRNDAAGIAWFSPWTYVNWEVGSYFGPSATLYVQR